MERKEAIVKLGLTQRTLKLMGSYHMAANTLLIDFKANPTMDLKAMKEILMERIGLDIPTCTCHRAKKRRKIPHAYEWLLDELVKHWAKYTFDPKLKCPNNRTNFVESFTSKIKKYKYKLIFSLLERKFMKTITNRLRISKEQKGKVVLKVKLLLVKAEKENQACRLTLAGKGIFEVFEGPTHFIIIPLSIDIKRGRPQTERRDITERGKEFTRSSTLKYSYCKQFGEDSPSYNKKRGKRRVRSPRKQGPLAKKSNTLHKPSSSRIATQPSSSNITG
ncbi:hypothetical protein Cgig2_008343 [Carnegiea gigantea]|uniref:Uncharacterized protein n=1 Tax=Carnegiea gigantea TaxID=171969 RepID=A0A9Q1GIU7_9CARY|nr:hypothetical protein Cgig2_017633 [Carnegiea gigantea]KAJ8437717.1 hypothetical protein Cgig2_008343 [Carnegiea gigantea]